MSKRPRFSPHFDVQSKNRQTIPLRLRTRYASRQPDLGIPYRLRFVVGTKRRGDLGIRQRPLLLAIAADDDDVGMAGAERIGQFVTVAARKFFDRSPQSRVEDFLVSLRIEF